LRRPSRPAFAQAKSLIFLDTRFSVDEYRVVFPVNVTSPSPEPQLLTVLQHRFQILPTDLMP
jgi:hypothetical protein